ncbi:hypothetical protein CC1G_11075 [Coprinopsis cinerea okayama7|uniref:Uncharacterized protein n=1 Tax=Coprinopsis cinerea (strain Okayama-7 / 130 / ATCC MYA-4618 / FGSC 9003) TaxID=240176 RepID=A8NCA6_COPC7|nr:hypothetical protein CC1G_11075 [Coprinopsis cinerea okayama7\|eukprot:XP_001832450.2 hypothetical protein CC1G_11075 [Coprinopsis cinerea okayama7\
MPGEGTKSSPILIDIDDSDEENQIAYELTATAESTGSPENPPLDIGEGSSHTAEQEANSPDGYGYGGQGGQSTGALPSSHPRAPGKRKRETSLQPTEGQPPNKQGRTLEDRLTNPPMSKSARKRQNKAEKIKRIQEENLRRLRHHPALVPRYPREGYIPGPNDNHFAFLPCNQAMFGQSTPAGPSYYGNGAYPGPEIQQQSTNAFVATWVDTMAWPAASTQLAMPQPYHPMTANYPPPEPEIPPPSLPPGPQLPSSVLPTVNNKPIPTGPKADMHGLPPKPPPQVNVPIGMKPDQDPNSKHGVFKIDSLDKTYIPNPARTLVMEQLPKSHRSVDFINSWCRKACGTQPLKVLIDTSAAKALIEFATSDLARRAWESPRLGAAYAGMKSHQLKGKPREDLIRVWWYRVDGVGAGAGVGEIEEGEIEGDAQEAEAQKKETKKEKKARLARERALKQEARMASLASPAQTSAPIAPLAPQQTLHPSHAFPPQGPLSSQHASAPLRPSIQLQMPPVDPAGAGIVHEQDMDIDDDMEVSPVQTVTPASPSTADTSPTLTVATKPGAGVVRELAPSESSPTHTEPTPSSNPKEDLKALLARQKELEAQIARSRLELAQRQSSSSTPQPQTRRTQSPALVNGNPTADSKQVESRLRERVKESQKAKQHQPNAMNGVVISSLTTSVVEVKAKSDGAVDSIMADAESFISSAIAGVKARSKTPPQPPTKAPTPPAATVRSTSTNNNVNTVELELKAKRLELLAAQIKSVMEKLFKAKTKEEKDVLRAKLKELDRQRSSEEASTASAVASSATSTPTVNGTGLKLKAPLPSFPQVKLPTPSPSVWPRFEQESKQLILDLSDDEDDED